MAVEKIDPQVFLDTASAIAEKLCGSALWEEDRCRWIGLTPVETPGGFAHQEKPLGPELYSGASGNLFFLSRLFRLTDDPLLRETADGAAREAITRLHELPLQLRSGFYSGWVGIAFALIELAESTGNADWLSAGLQMLKSVDGIDDALHPSDVLLGTAGAIPPLLSLHRRYPEAGLLSTATRWGDHLLSTAHRRDEGWSWEPFGPFNDLHRDHLTGFAHGVGGIAWALLELYGATGEERYREGAEEGFRYERKWYVPERGNWLDLRYMPGPDGNLNTGNIYQIQWCHGAVGLGLTRLRAFEMLGNSIYREEAERAIRTTIGDMRKYPKNWQPNFSLCHGLAGNADLLIEGSRILGEPELLQVAEEGGLLGIELYRKDNEEWPGALGKKEIPSLMTGVAGTGLFYLRLYDPERTAPITLVGNG